MLEPISYPESSGFLVSGTTPGRLWGHRKNSIFLIGCSVTVSIVLPQKSCGNKIRCPQSLPGVAPLTKKPEDSGYEIVLEPKQGYLSHHAWLTMIARVNVFVRVCCQNSDRLSWLSLFYLPNLYSCLANAKKMYL